MKLVDANILLYAVNSDSDRHEESRRWLDGALSGAATVAFSWVALLAFVRLSTKIDLFPSPLSIDGALDRVGAWLSSPSAVTVEPGPDHLATMRRLLSPLGTGGNLVNDAHLAAIALTHRCDIVTWDRDFGRFDGVRVEHPSV